MSSLAKEYETLEKVYFSLKKIVDDLYTSAEGLEDFTNGRGRGMSEKEREDHDKILYSASVAEECIDDVRSAMEWLEKVV